MNISQFQKLIEPVSGVRMIELASGFPVIEVNSRRAQASISLYGGQLLSYKPHKQPQDLIWLSDRACFKKGKAIRGGIPVCWPWFANNELYDNQPAHGFARNSFWQPVDITALENGNVAIKLAMNKEEGYQHYKKVASGFKAELSIIYTIGDNLSVDLISVNQGAENLYISQALHSYFNISHINQINITGLETTDYIDKLNNNSINTQNDVILISGETDRVYQGTMSDIWLNDQGFKRRLRICKQNSNSTVIWNPGPQNSVSMTDLSDTAWLNMICVEVANVGKHVVEIPPGDRHQLSMKIDVYNDS